ncbi:hypothetical protein PG2000B_1103 [Bifidobacterium pseudolongum subsp. globosum]|uniref:hypothetical protein n=1 Tax=Bifidobacterium pseudolongum TaxID=1694 RepID=UPI001021FAB3|nr:hypothetical protein [Bifidobacterium pseudolongum]RYQ42410.1 hypothetical protein PG2000B_1103 [Bifidobacterium pseudolongum subsp. globosum]
MATIETERDTNNTLSTIAHQLTRIADAMQPTGMQVTEEDALAAWGLRIYEEEFLTAVEKLGVEII